MAPMLLLIRFPSYSPTRRCHPHCPHPHWVQLMQPEDRTTGPAQSGQTRMRYVRLPDPPMRPATGPVWLGW